MILFTYVWVIKPNNKGDIEMNKQELKALCFDKLEKMNNNKAVKQNPNASRANVEAMIKAYNYGNYLVALILKDEGWSLEPNQDIKAIDLVGSDPSGNDVAVEVKTEFYPSSNFFVEIKDACWGAEKIKDYWERAKDNKPTYFASVCGNTKTLHLYDLTMFTRHTDDFRAIRSRFQTTGYLWDKNTDYPFKIGVYELGI